MSSSSPVCSAIFPTDSGKSSISSRVRGLTGVELDSVSATTIMEHGWVGRRSSQSWVGSRAFEVTLVAMIVTSSTANSPRFLAGPSLKHFILRQQVLNLYRSAIRATRCTQKPLSLDPGICIHIYSEALPRHARSETIAWVRHEFERNRHLQDTVSLRTSGECRCSNAPVTGEDQG